MAALREQLMHERKRLTTLVVEEILEHHSDTALLPVRSIVELTKTRKRQAGEPLDSWKWQKNWSCEVDALLEFHFVRLD